MAERFKSFRKLMLITVYIDQALLARVDEHIERNKSLPGFNCASAENCISDWFNHYLSDQFNAFLRIYLSDEQKLPDTIEIDATLRSGQQIQLMPVSQTENMRAPIMATLMIDKDLIALIDLQLEANRAMQSFSGLSAEQCISDAFDQYLSGHFNAFLSAYFKDQALLTQAIKVPLAQ